VVPIDVGGLEKAIWDYEQVLTKEFEQSRLERTYREFINKLKQKDGFNKTYHTLDFQRSTMAHWHDVGQSHLKEIQQLRDRCKTLFEILPPLSQESLSPYFDVRTPGDLRSSAPSIFDAGFKKLDDVSYPKFNNSVKTPHNSLRGKRDASDPAPEQPFSHNDPYLAMGPITKPSSGTSSDGGNVTQVREKRSPLLVAGAVLGVVAGTAFGIYNTIQINKIWGELEKVDKKILAFEQTLSEFSKDMVEIQDEVHGFILKDIADNAFDSGVLLSRLRIQYTDFQDKVNRMFSVLQEVQHRRLATDYLDDVTLKQIYSQAKSRARSVNHYVVIRQPSDLFQVEASYTYDGKRASLILHIPIAPPESVMRLYRLHPFPLPFTNNTFLLPDVRDDLLAISNSNHRFTMQLSSIDLLGCNNMGRTYLCERNGLLYKYPEDTCLGALYHQRYEEAKSICTFHLEPAREYIRQLKDNWYLIYVLEPITIPLSCLNDTFSELHLKAGSSKFQLPAGCIADLPRHRMSSDLSILIPKDYVQFEMDWNPQTFLPDIRDYVIPEFEKLRRYGQSRVSLGQLQSVLATMRENPAAWYHDLHFSGNALALACSAIAMFLGVYKCAQMTRRRRQERRAKRIEDAVRTAMNAANLAPPSYLPHMRPSYPNTVVTYDAPGAAELVPLTLSRRHSFSNLTSVSEKPPPQFFRPQTPHSTID